MRNLAAISVNYSFQQQPLAWKEKQMVVSRGQIVIGRTPFYDEVSKLAISYDTMKE